MITDAKISCFSVYIFSLNNHKHKIADYCWRLAYDIWERGFEKEIKDMFTTAIYLLWFLVPDFLLLTDVNELIHNEYSECMISHLNISNWFTHSHPSKAENFDRNHSKCKVKVQTGLVPIEDINDDIVFSLFNLVLIPSMISNTKPLLRNSWNILISVYSQMLILFHTECRVRCSIHSVWLWFNLLSTSWVIQ